jgi:hypothetical protein
VTFKNSDGSNRQSIIKDLAVGQKLRVQHDSANPFDANCQKLTTVENKEVGNLKRELASDVMNGQKNGWHYYAVVKEITGRDKQTLGVNIELIATK